MKKFAIAVFIIVLFVLAIRALPKPCNLWLNLAGRADALFQCLMEKR